MYRKIMVPLDGSQLSEIVLPYAAELAAKSGSKVTLVYVLPSVDEWYQVHQLYLEEMANVIRWAAKESEGKQAGREITIDTQVLIGNPAEEITEFADRTNVDLIVMATHGRSGIKRLALGSIAEEVEKTTNTPVVFIRSKDNHPVMHETVKLNRVLVPLDGSQDSETVIPYIKELALELNAEITLLRVLSTDIQDLLSRVYGCRTQIEELIEQTEGLARDYINNIRTRLQNEGIAVKTIFKHGFAADMIVRVAEDTQADMIAMSTHGMTGLKSWVFSSVANKVLHTSKTPLLLVKSPEAVRAAGRVAEAPAVSVS